MKWPTNTNGVGMVYCVESPLSLLSLKTFRPSQKGRRFQYDILKYIFLKENV